VSRKQRIKTALIILAAIAVVLLAIGPVRMYQASREVNAIMKDSGISTAYECTHAESREDLYASIGRLAAWEEKTRDSINQAYGHTDKEYSRKVLEGVSGYESREKLIQYAMEDKWRKERKALSDIVWGSIKTLFGDSTEEYGISRFDVQACYSNDYFDEIADVIQALDQNDGAQAYSIALYGLSSAQKRKWTDQYTALPMDIAYTLKPKIMVLGCEEVLASTKNEESQYTIGSIVASAEYFEERYGVSVEGLSSARTRRDRLEYESRPDIPKIGMTTAQARSTKLGSPTRTTREKSTYAHADHYWGHMYWDKGGRQIFAAYYSDNEIKEVWDTRDYTGKPSRKYSGSSSKSSSSSFDPDDHDIEAYYEDNRDEYDDYDDAYEGFMDDESAWDDY